MSYCHLLFCRARGTRATRWMALLLLVMLGSGLMSACRRGETATTGETIRLTCMAPVSASSSEPGQLTFFLTDENDEPIDTAALQIRGDMSHAGMIPLLAAMEGGEDGIYRIPVEWTMSGDWIVTVEATLDDGRQAVRSFDFAVTGQEALCVEEE